MKLNLSRSLVLFTLMTALIATTACRKRRHAVTADQAASSQILSAGRELIIGEIGSLTGNEATFGTSTRDGIELAVRQINQSGGIKGHTVRVKVYDDQGKAEEAAAAITKLITEDHAIAILGEVASSRSLAAAPIAQRYQVPMISPSSTNPKVTQVGDYIFRVCFIDPFQGYVMAKFASTYLKAHTAAILRDVKSDYSIGLADVFTRSFKAAGGTIVRDEAYSGGDVHFKSQLTALRSIKPDVIFIPGYYTEVALIARQARELGIEAPLLGGDGWDSPKLLEIGSKYVNNAYFSNHYSDEQPTPEVKRFVTD